jgi:hypothetical protein
MSMIISGTDGLTFNNATVQASAGQVLQVVNTTTQFNGVYASITSTSLVTTGLTVSITPKFATSKIMIIVSAWCGTNGASVCGAFTIYRNGTNLATGTAQSVMSMVINGGNTVNTPMSINYLDSPATTSATTYTLYGSTSSGTAYISPIPAQVNSGVVSITAMEIAA